MDAVLSSFVVLAGALYVAKYGIASTYQSQIAMQLRSNQQLPNIVRHELYDDPILHEQQVIRSAIYNATGIDLHAYNQSHLATLTMFDKHLDVFPFRHANGSVHHYVTKYDMVAPKSKRGSFPWQCSDDHLLYSIPNSLSLTECAWLPNDG